MTQYLSQDACCEKVENQRRRRASAQSFIHRTHARPWDEHSRLRRSAGNQRACLLTTLFVLPTGRVLTTLKAPDERGEATLPQVRGSSLPRLPRDAHLPQSH